MLEWYSTVANFDICTCVLTLTHFSETTYNTSCKQHMFAVFIDNVVAVVCVR